MSKGRKKVVRYDIGKRLKEIRGERKLSQAALTANTSCDGTGATDDGTNTFDTGSKDDCSPGTD